MKKALSRHLVAGLFFIAILGPAFGDVPHLKTMPLSAIIRSIETGQYGSIKSIEFDDGLWEAEVCKDTCSKLYIQPQSGAIARTEREDAEKELPPQGSLPLSKIVASLEEQKLGVITEVEFDDGFWEVKIRKNGTRTKLDIDPKTGQPRG